MMLYIIPYLFYSLLALLGIFLQAEFFSFIPIFGIKPDLLVIIAALAGLHTGGKNGAAAGAVVGLWADLLAAGFFGIHILVYALIGFLVGSIKKQQIFKTYPGYFFLVLLASLSSGILYIIGYDLVGGNYPFWQSLFAIVVPFTLYNCILVVIFFPVIFIYRRFRGLKVGYVDMFGGGIILTTGNRKVDLEYVRKRKAQHNSARRESQKKRARKSQLTRGTTGGRKQVPQQYRKGHEPSREYGQTGKNSRSSTRSEFYNEGYYGISPTREEPVYRSRRNEDPLDKKYKTNSNRSSKTKRKQNKSVRRNSKGIR